MGKAVKFQKDRFDKYQKTDKKRREGVRKLRERFLILCEGTKTEPNYFNAFKRELPKGIVEIDILGLGVNTLSILDEAKKLFDKSKQGTAPYDEVWLVFDRDSFPAHNFDNTIKGATANKFYCAWSNEAFELWYLLHFEFRNTAMPRNEYKYALNKYLGREYKKNDERMYADLLSYQQTAIRNAERLKVINNSSIPSSSNPGTQVHLLVLKLNDYIIR